MEEHRLPPRSYYGGLSTPHSVPIVFANAVAPYGIEELQRKDEKGLGTCANFLEFTSGPAIK